MSYIYTSFILAYILFHFLATSFKGPLPPKAILWFHGWQLQMNCDNGLLTNTDEHNLNLNLSKITTFLKLLA